MRPLSFLILIVATSAQAAPVSAPVCILPPASFSAAVDRLVFSQVAVAETQESANAPSAEEIEFLKILNAYREENHLKPLQFSPVLMKSSRFFANDIATDPNHYQAGKDPHSDRLNRDLGARLDAFGYKWVVAAENLAPGYSSAQEAFVALRASKNMLNPGMEDAGIARVEVPNSKYKVYWVIDFGALSQFR